MSLSGSPSLVKGAPGLVPEAVVHESAALSAHIHMPPSRTRLILGTLVWDWCQHLTAHGPSAFSLWIFTFKAFQAVGLLILFPTPRADCQG